MAASRIASGDYATRVPASRLGAEFAMLDNAFNRMAAALQGSEDRRRELLADLAHELRTPIATIDSFLEGVEDGVIPATADTWHTLRQQTTRLRRLVHDIDSVSRAEERPLNLHPVPVDVDDVVVEAVTAAGAGFTDKAVALRHAGQVAVTVTDTGDGIAAEHLPHLFDRFYRADPARSRATGGSGIGLTIARALARAHGGDLRADSDGPGHGATFHLTLPAAPTT